MAVDRGGTMKNRHIAGFIFCIFLIFFLRLTAEAGEAVLDADLSGQAQEAESDADLSRQAEEELLDLYDFSGADEALSGTEWTFSGLVGELLAGNFDGLLEKGMKSLGNIFFSELRVQKNALLKLLLLAVLSAFLSNIAVVLEQNEVAQTGSYIIGLLLAGTLLGAFSCMEQMVADVTGQGMQFLKVMIPSLVLSVGLCSGKVTALGYGELGFFVIYGGELCIRRILLPLIRIYVVCTIVNQMLPKDELSQAAKGIRKLVLWILKAYMGIVMGLNIMKGILLPAAGKLEKTAGKSLLSLFPGSDAVSGAADLMYACAVVVKNAVGGGAIIGMIILCGIPFLKMMAFLFGYRFLSAAVQPMTQPFVSGSIAGVADGVALLGKVLYTQILLLVLTVGILCAVTS